MPAAGYLMDAEDLTEAEDEYFQDVCIDGHVIGVDAAASPTFEYVDTLSCNQYLVQCCGAPCSYRCRTWFVTRGPKQLVCRAVMISTQSRMTFCRTLSG